MKDRKGVHMKQKYESIRPGQVWLDTKGERIQAHGGSVMFWDGWYYWYGENKEFTDLGEKLWHWGVRCYRSQDLYNLEDLGVIVPPCPDDPSSPLHPTSKMDRPHIIYNAKTKKFVCWLKIMERDFSQTETILTADAITGPYTMVKKGFKPLGMSGGDFDLVVAEDGKAYYYFEHPHSEMICAELTEDYTDVTGVYSMHFPGQQPPYAREAPAHFVRNGKHYLFTSGTTSKFPNPSEVAVADSWHGPFRVLGDPHGEDESRTSYHSQISSVLKVEGKKDLYIACADRWRPQDMDVKYEEYEKYFCDMFNKDTPKDQQEASRKGYAALPLAYTREADYVWLPLRFDGEMVYLDWHDEWKISDYE